MIQFFSWFATAVVKFHTQPLTLTIAILINFLIYFGLWSATVYAIKNPQGKSQNKKADIARWLMSLFFSIFAVEIGVTAMFLSRIFLDAAYTNGNPVVASLWSSKLLNAALTMLALIIAYPILYLVNKTLKFKNPTRQTIIMSILWAILILFVGPLWPSS